MKYSRAECVENWAFRRWYWPTWNDIAKVYTYLYFLPFSRMLTWRHQLKNLFSLFQQSKAPLSWLSNFIWEFGGNVWRSTITNTYIYISISIYLCRGCLSCAPYWGPARIPGMCPRLGIQPATLWFTGWYSTTEPHQPGPLFMFLSAFSSLTLKIGTFTF